MFNVTINIVHRVQPGHGRRPPVHVQRDVRPAGGRPAEVLHPQGAAHSHPDACRWGSNRFICVLHACLHLNLDSICSIFQRLL